MKILIVDDNSEIRRLIISMLGEIAGEVYECEDGERAIEIYASLRPDWILMDVMMKRTDGLVATRKIKEIDRRAKIAVVTNHADQRTRQAAKEAGADAFFGKDDLLGMISFLSKNQ